ncbi:MAG: peptidoglycan-binding protein [Microthrixaceae bacterium]|nr:peptidoglycan-binding protein [Microthrixaceae bacterium]
MGRRAVLAGAGSVVLVGLVAAGLVLARSGDAAAPASKPSVRRSTATVERTDLVASESLDAKLGPRDPVDLAFAKPGTITGLSAVGSVIDRGGVLGEVDGRPIVLLLGDRPLWRTLTADPVGADGQPVDQLTGADVRVLEENLQALGFITDTSDAKVDDTFTGSTGEAVKAWQKSLGLPQTGVVEPSDVVVRESPIRIVSRSARVGMTSGGNVLSVAATDTVVTIELAAKRVSLVSVGLAVTVTLPDGRSVPAKVAAIGSDVTAGDPNQGTADTVKVEVRLDDPSVIGSLTSAPVKVVVTTSTAESVLAVPIAALLALSEGGYAVERVEGDSSKLVGVETGVFAGGLVEVRPAGGVALAEGDRVVVPT